MKSTTWSTQSTANKNRHELEKAIMKGVRVNNNVTHPKQWPSCIKQKNGLENVFTLWKYLAKKSVWARDDWKDFLGALKTIRAIKANINWQADQLADTGAQLRSKIKKAQRNTHSKTHNKIKENQNDRL